MRYHIQAERFHAMDALRAAMMLAVVLLHVAMMYASSSSIKSVFQFADPDQGPGFNVIVMALQQTSMPTLFLVAGFFTARHAATSGERAMVVGRLKRITVPFLVLWLPLFVLVCSGIFFGCLCANTVTVCDPVASGVRVRHIGARVLQGEPLLVAVKTTGARPEDTVVSTTGSSVPGNHAAGVPTFVCAGPGLPVREAFVVTAKLTPLTVAFFFHPAMNRPIHLWFSWVLTVFAVAAALLGPFARRLPTERVAPVLESFAYPLLLAAPLTIAFFVHGTPYIPPPQSLLVPWSTLFCYALFFGTGSLLWRHRDRLPILGRWWPAHLLMAVVTMPAAVSFQVDGDCMTMALCAAVAHTQLTWAAIGVFQRFFHTERAWVRYLSDASHWMYLVHLPVVLWTSAALLSWEMSRHVKFPLVVAVSVGAPLASYAVFVRRTVFGLFLDGKWPGCPEDQGDQRKVRPA